MAPTATTLQLALKPEAWRKEICSCKECDSFGCFAIRYHSACGCSCLKCDHSKTCIFYKTLNANLNSDTKENILETLNANLNSDTKENILEVDSKLLSKKYASTPSCNCKRSTKSCDKNSLWENLIFGKCSEINTECQSHNKNVLLKRNENDYPVQNLTKHPNPTTLYCINKQIECSAKENVSKSNIFPNDEQRQYPINSNSKPDSNSQSIINLKSNPDAMEMIRRCIQREIRIMQGRVKCKSNITDDTKNQSNLTSYTEVNAEEGPKHLLNNKVEIKEKETLCHQEDALKTKDKSENHAVVEEMLRNFIHRDNQEAQVYTKKEDFGPCCDDKDIKSETSSKIKIKTTKIETKNSNVNADDIDICEVEKEIILQVDTSTKLSESNNAVANTISLNKKVSAAELRAQIMNVPYSEYKQSFSSPDNKTKNSKFDLLQKIKAVYDACSCKMCQCIGVVASFSNNEKCNCEPCECNKCRGFRKDNRGLFKKCYNSETHIKRDSDATCKCKPCDCIQCVDTVQTSCHCKPCDCIQCKSMRVFKPSNYIIAPVEDGQQRGNCGCTPCSCYACGNPYPTIQTSHDASTDDRRHMNCYCDSCDNDNCEQEGADTCTCDRHSKVMRKPVLKDTNDYDIRHATISDFDRGYKINNSNETLTMFASVPNRGISFNKNNVGIRVASDTSSTQYDCSYTSQATSHNVWNIPNSNIIPNTARSNEFCNCKPCECLKCKIHYLDHHVPQIKDVCLCEICDCINCATMTVSYDIEKKYNTTNTKDPCLCKPCDCVECRKYMKFNNDFSRKNITKEHSSNTYNSSRSSEANNSSNYLTLLKASDSDDFIDLLLTDTESKNHTGCKKGFNSTKNKSFTNNTKHFYCAVTPTIKCEHHKLNSSKFNILKKDINKKYIKTKPRYNASCTNEKIGNTNIYRQTTTRIKRNDLVFSSASSSGTSHVDGSSSVLPEDQDGKSTGSSCNSSGHDNSNYLIRFPKSTVETCIRDVMNLKSYKKSNTTGLKASIAQNSDKTFSDFSNSARQNNNTLSFKGKRFFETVEILRALDTEGTSNIKKCKNWNSESPCDCYPCDCEKCNYEVKKPIRCNCDCSECSCFGTCTSDDHSVYIRKNQISQTIGLMQDLAEVSMYNNTFRPETTNIMRSSYPKFYNYPNSGLPKESRSLSKKSNVTFDEVYIKSRECPFFCKSYTFNDSTVPKITNPNAALITHESVQKTLQESKEFSLELLKILQKYEKANREFSSMSERYKMAQEHKIALQNKINVKKPEKANTLSVNTNKHNLKNEEVGNNQTYYVLAKNVEPIKPGGVNLSRHVLESNNQGSQNKIHNNILAQTTAEKNELNKQALKASVIRKAKLNELQIQYKKYSQHLNKSIAHCSQNVWNKNMPSNKYGISETQNTSPVVKFIRIPNKSAPIHIIHKPNTDQIIKDRCNSKLKDSSTDNNNKEKQKSKLSDKVIKEKRCSELKESNTDKINKGKDSHKQIKLNTDMTIEEKHSRELNAVFLNSDKKDETQQTSQLSSSQVTSVLNEKQHNSLKTPKADHSTIIVNELKGETEIWTQVGGFESTPSVALKKQYTSAQGAKSSIATDADFIESEQNSYDSLKVSFQVVRKVSDHTVLLKWRVPEVTTDILGYELLVNGRAVQKTLSATRNMAVVTCLPHHDSVHITIRTITTLDAWRGRHPCANYLYRTRGK